jgi:hypothetical protein
MGTSFRNLATNLEQRRRNEEHSGTKKPLTEGLFALSQDVATKYSVQASSILPKVSTSVGRVNDLSP